MNEQEIRDLMFFSFRYALGRQSGAVSIVTEILKKYWNLFEKWEQEKIHTEIKTQEEFYSLGMSCDKADWYSILELKIKEK